MIYGYSILFAGGCLNFSTSILINYQNSTSGFPVWLADGVALVFNFSQSATLAYKFSYVIVAARGANGFPSDHLSNIIIPETELTERNQQ